VTVQFQDHDAFSYGSDAWSWTNAAFKNTAILVAGAGDCNDSPSRLPFVVSSVAFDDTANSATWTGYPADWKSVAHSFDLHVGGVPAAAPVPGATAFHRRDVSKNFTFGFNHQLSIDKSIPLTDDLSVQLGCDSCGTSGEFIFEFDIHQVPIIGIANGASLTIVPNGVSANFNPSIGMSLNLTDKLDVNLPVATVPIEGFDFELVNFGPSLTFSLDGFIGPASGSATLSTGVSISLEDSAKLSVSLSPPGFDASGLTPHVSRQPLTLTGELNVGVQLGLDASLNFNIDAFRKQTVFVFF
jgi:hypothetical protein